MSSSIDMANDTPHRQAGPLGRAFIRAFLKQAQVAAIESLSSKFRLITLRSPAFRFVDWMPGQKLQIAMGSAFVTRTYTPIDWDREMGQTRILGYVHGRGPGSDWLRNARVGDVCNVMGPRKSIDTSSIGDAPILFGDETSIGLAYALQQGDTNRNLTVFLESSDRAGVRAVMATLGLDNVLLFAATEGTTQLDEIEAHLNGHARNHSDYILTGHAQSIQRIRRKLKELALPPQRIEAKAYWAIGKTGLD